ncbi:VOC family protein [Kaistia terrae]|uniref:VOC family protein n=1 Tax=Kaistia terrae TaxID=537017 RepID=A0ABW0Q0G1_9HYPH|nr:VOC family protein [Kaistia terrae]MCX5580429.1 VOC family protein [Kaistia terrae]
MTTTPNMILLYVKDTAASAAFYTDLLGQPAMNASPNFAALPLDNGLTLGLWGRAQAKPATTATANGANGEIVFMVENKAKIEALYADWQQRGLPIEQELVELDFGPTFVALDPDGHRLRVCLPDA